MFFRAGLLLTLGAVVMGFVSLTAATQTIFPKPAHVAYDEGKGWTVNRDKFHFTVTGFASDVLTQAYTRYQKLIFNSAPRSTRLSAARMRFNSTVAAPSFPEVSELEIEVSSKDLELYLGVDEAYILDTTRPGTAVLSAPTVFGAIRGLESFYQLLDFHANADGSLFLQSASVSDKPRFEYRGFLIDTARHYYPLTVILQHLDAMAYAKLNVLHWHIVDDTSFPYVSTAFPEMSASGAFSPKHVYTHDDINRVQDYAYLRGIRVIPEFDVPGHVTKGYTALKPQIVTDCIDYKYPTGPLNPTINATFEFLDKFYDELKTVWRDNYYHIGGDEVIKTCWGSNPDVMKWLKAHPEVGDLNGLQNYFIGKLLDMLKEKGLSYMVWQEVFDSGAKLKPETVVEVWIPANWQKTMAKVVKGGNRVVLAAPYYLNYIAYGLDWHTFYGTEPTNFTGGAAAEANGLISGIEVAMWSEYVDATNFIARSWARSAAVAERAWSDAKVVDIDDATRRMHQWRCKAIARNIDAEPITNGASMLSPVGFNHHCPQEWVPAYAPLE